MIRSVTELGVCRLVVLAVLPLVLLLLLPVLAAWSGPRHIEGNSDPQYLYMLNGLAVAAGGQPGHLDHPGATVHVLAAATLHVARSGVPVSDLVEEMLRNPEPMGHWIAWVLVGISAVLVFVAGVLVAGAPGFTVGHGLFVQLWPFTFPVVWNHVPFVSPDFFLLCQALFFCALALRLPASMGSAAALGAVLGFMLVTKVTALLFTAAPLFLYRRRFSHIVVAWSAAGAVFAGFILFLYRANLKYYVAYTFGWFWALATRRGWYGDGGTGVPSVSVILGNLGILALELPHFFLAVIFCLAMLALSLRRRENVTSLATLLAFLAAGQIFLIAKATAPRYAMPALPVAGLALLLAIRNGRSRFLNGFVALCLAATVVSLVVTRARFVRHRDTTLAALAAVPEGKPVICSGLGSRIDCALHLGNNFTRNFFTEELKRLYPIHYLWGGGVNGSLLEFGNSEARLTDVVTRYGEVVFQGHSLELGGKYPFEDSSLRVQRVYETGELQSVWSVRR